MGRLTCEICGGALKKHNEAEFECVSCGALYSVEDLKQKVGKKDNGKPQKKSEPIQKKEEPVQKKEEAQGYQEPPERTLFQTTIGWLHQRPITFTTYGIEWEGKKYLFSKMKGYTNVVVKKQIRKVGFDACPIHYGTDFNIVLVTEEGEKVEISLDNRKDFDTACAILWEWLYKKLYARDLFALICGEEILVKEDDLNRRLYLTPDGVRYEFTDYHFFGKNEEKVELLKWVERDKTWRCYIGDSLMKNGGYWFEKLVPKKETLFLMNETDPCFKVFYSIVELAKEKNTKSFNAHSKK